jgi:replication-associated recombination protein RarA
VLQKRHFIISYKKIKTQKKLTEKKDWKFPKIIKNDKIKTTKKLTEKKDWKFPKIIKNDKIKTTKKNNKKKDACLLGNVRIFFF